jgi:hypothetical protein
MRREMDDRDKSSGDMEQYLDSLDEQVELKVEQLLHETQDPRGDEDLELRALLLDGYVPLIDDSGKRIFKRRSELTLEDTRRFGAFMALETERRQREIGDTSESSEN